MHASAYRLLRLLASVCKGALTPLYAGLIAIASSSLQRIASDDSGSFASGSLCCVRSEVCSKMLMLKAFTTELDMPHGNAVHQSERAFSAHVGGKQCLTALMCSHADRRVF